MTQEEQDRLISDMVKKRNALRHERTLLDEQISQTQQGMRDAAGAANLLHQGNTNALERGFSYQDAETFAVTLKRRHAVELRLEELTQRLDACC